MATPLYMVVQEVLLWTELDKTAALFAILEIVCIMYANVPPFGTFFAVLIGIPLVAATLWIMVAAVYIPLYWELPNNIFRRDSSSWQLLLEMVIMMDFILMFLPPFPVGVVIVLLFTIPVTLSPYIPAVFAAQNVAVPIAVERCDWRSPIHGPGKSR